jgi:hypothetical protein
MAAYSFEHSNSALTDCHIEVFHALTLLSIAAVYVTSSFVLLQAITYAATRLVDKSQHPWANGVRFRAQYVWCKW